MCGVEVTIEGHAVYKHKPCYFRDIIGSIFINTHWQSKLSHLGGGGQNPYPFLAGKGQRIPMFKSILLQKFVIFKQKLPIQSKM